MARTQLLTEFKVMLEIQCGDIVHVDYNCFLILSPKDLSPLAPIATAGGDSIRLMTDIYIQGRLV